MTPAEDKFTVPTDRALAERYDDDLAENLLKLAKATDKISTDEFAAQLWTWASATAELLQSGLDHGRHPTVADLRSELQKLSKGVHEFMGSLASLPTAAYPGLGQALCRDAEFDEYRNFAEAEAFIQQAIQQMDALHHAASRAADECDGRASKDGAKNRRQSVRRMATMELGMAWQVLTGKRPTRRNHNLDHGDTGESYGEFQEFVMAALTPLFGEKEAASGVDGVIRKVVAAMEKTPSKTEACFFHI